VAAVGVSPTPSGWHAIDFVIITHDERLAAQCDRIVYLVDGRVASDGAALTHG
jgi:ABC-type hemin transport system ATPase subunit